MFRSQGIVVDIGVGPVALVALDARLWAWVHWIAAPMPWSRAGASSVACYQSLDVILCLDKYALSVCHIKYSVFLSVCSLGNHFCMTDNSIAQIVLD
jgi:hypothetical protein